MEPARRFQLAAGTVGLGSDLDWICAVHFNEGFSPRQRLFQEIKNSMEVVILCGG
jgi:hypothetical protein